MYCLFFTLNQRPGIRQSYRKRKVRPGQQLINLNFFSMALEVTFGVSTWLWTSPFTTASIHELFPKISKLGFDVVEIAVENPALIDIKEVKKGLDLYGLKGNIC